MTAWAVVAALLGALGYALAAVLQHQEATRLPADTGGSELRLLLHLAGRPRWLAGVAATGVAASLHVLALRWGPLVLVQPIGVTGLLFALPLAAVVHDRPVSKRELLAAVAVVVGLIGLLTAVQVPHTGPRMSDEATPLLSAAIGLVTLAATLLGRRLSGRPRAVVLALAAGVAFGITSALVRVVASSTALAGLPDGLLDWPTAAVLASALAGLTLLQSAYRAGSLGAVLPLVTIVDPLVAIGVGQLLLGEPIRMTVPGALGAAMSAAVLVVATTYLARSQAPLHRR